VADLDAYSGESQGAISCLKCGQKPVHASAACKAGIQRVHIINGRVDEGLLAEGVF
jgi:acetylglutamate kinase